MLPQSTRALLRSNSTLSSAPMERPISRDSSKRVQEKGGIVSSKVFPDLSPASLAEEDTDAQKPGGYCVVHVGETIGGGRYMALEKIGSGHFSTVWLCYDWLMKYVVGIKFQKSAKRYTEAAKEEIFLLREVAKKGRNACPVVLLLDHFEHFGSCGKHICLVFEVLGKSLLSLVKRFDYRGLSLRLVKKISKSVLEGLFFLHHECKIIHADLKPENVLLVPLNNDMKALNEEGTRRAHELKVLKSLDPLGMTTKPLTKNKKRRLKAKQKKAAQSHGFESPLDIESFLKRSALYENARNSSRAHNSAGLNERRKVGKPHNDLRSLLGIINSDQVYMRGLVRIIDLGNALWSEHHGDHDIQTCQYRSPEVIIGASYGTSADIWSAACLIFELATGEYLFELHSGRHYQRDEDHLALMMELLGPMSKNVALCGRWSSSFLNCRAQLRRVERLRFCPLDVLLMKCYDFSMADAEAFASFLLPMLHFDPTRRATAQECLAHSFLTGE